MTRYILMIVAFLSLFNAQTYAQILNKEQLEPEAKMLRDVRKSDSDKTISMSVPLYGGILKFNLIDDFEPAFQAQDARQFIKEFVPAGETVKNWSKMITIIALKNAGRLPNTNQEIIDLLSSTRKCDGYTFAKLISEEKLEHGLSLTKFSGGCGENNAQSYTDAVAGTGEQNIIFMYRDSVHIQMLQYAVRGTAYAENEEPLDTAKIQDIEASLNPIAFCMPENQSETCTASRAAEILRKAQ